MTKESKFDVMWMKNLIAYVDYIKTNYRFPSSQTIYQEHKIGYWIRNQISAKKRGGLTKERERMLNCLMPVWNKSQKEKQQYLDSLLQIDWETQVVPGKHSLLKVKGFEKSHNMRHLHLSNIHTCEDYIVYITKNHIAKEKVCSVYCEIYPFLTTSTALFLCTLFDISYKLLSDPDQMESFFLQFPYLTKRHTEKRIQLLLLILPKKQRTIVEKKLGLYGAPMSYQAIGNEYQLTKEAIRQQYKNALSRLCNPKAKQLLFTTETDLDLLSISPITKSVLYKNEICKKEQILSLLQDENKIKNLSSNSAYRHDIINLKETISHLPMKHPEEMANRLKSNQKNTTSLETLQLSFRSYNALRRFGISNFEELTNYCGLEPNKKLFEIPGLGKKCVHEICQKTGLC